MGYKHICLESQLLVTGGPSVGPKSLEIIQKEESISTALITGVMRSKQAYQPIPITETRKKTFLKECSKEDVITEAITKSNSS